MISAWWLELLVWLCVCVLIFTWDHFDVYMLRAVRAVAWYARNYYRDLVNFKTKFWSQQTACVRVTSSTGVNFAFCWDSLPSDPASLLCTNCIKLAAFSHAILKYLFNTLNINQWLVMVETTQSMIWSHSTSNILFSDGVVYIKIKLIKNNLLPLNR